MRSGTAAGLLLATTLLAGCGPDWQPSWNMSSQPPVPGDSLTIRRVTGQEAEFSPLRSESVQDLRLSAGELRSSIPTGPEAAMTGAPDYRPVPRPDIERQTAPPRPASQAPAPRVGSSTPPPVISPPPPAPAPRPPATTAVPRDRDAPLRDGTVVTIPGQPSGVVTNSTGRVSTFTQPGNPAGGVAVQDGGTTTVIQPGGRVTTIPTPR
ncbi:hypothetical protein J5Y09_21740 [Roseomonas sp. PWR1]|uniref:Translation initiation factor 2 n=1 Tax=Roseomonas nitratireducens TaxID=2820810 RepID=A0ABS4AYZ3_9PROT|nr:hypothetical protein [Neoroseomonas nitratireducens]MBP0466566.1 hypothetical protein [Neoroseomonas nitratireducens]